MSINKAELITQILAQSSLTGEDLNKLKQELHTKSLAELSTMLSNAAPEEVTFKNFVELPKEQEKYAGNIWQSSIVNNYGDYLSFSASSAKNPAPAKKITPAEERAAREFTKEYLTTATESAMNLKNTYAQNYSFLDRMWSGLKNTANLLDTSPDGKAITTNKELVAFLDEEYNSAQILKNSKQKGAFEFQFLKTRGIEFNPANVLNFKKQSESFLQLSVLKDKSDTLNNDFKELQNIYKKEQALQKLKNMGQNIPASAYPSTNFETKFLQTIDNYCNGNENLKKQLISQISNDAGSKSQLPPKKDILNYLQNLNNQTKHSLNQQLNGKSYNQHKNEYEAAHKLAFGSSNTEEFTKSWLENQQNGALGVKFALTIAATALSGGVVNPTATTLIKTAQIAKNTVYGLAASTTLDYAGALSSQSGLTKEKNEQILTTAKNAIPYAFFGAFVSGPLGSKITSALKSSPSTPQILQKAFNTSAQTTGFASEITADALFELAISDGELLNILQNNATGESQARLFNKFGSMLTGGRANAAAKAALRNAGLENAKIRQTAGNKYELITPDGKNYIADSPESLLGGIFAKVGAGLETSASKVKKKPANPFLGDKIHENDQINTIKTPDTGIPAFKGASKSSDVPFVLKEAVSLTPDEFKSALKSLQFTDEEIKSIDLNDKEASSIVSAFKLISENKMPEDWDFSDAEFRSEFSELLKNPNSDEAKTFKYVNKENLEYLDKYIKSDCDFEQKMRFISDCMSYGNGNIKAVFEKLPILSKMSPDGKLSAENLKDLAWVYADDLAKITPQCIEIVRKINEQVPEQFMIKVSDLSYLRNTSGENVQNYVKEANRASKFPVEFSSTGDLAEAGAKMKAVSDMLERYPMDLKLESGEKVSSYYLVNIANRKDLSDVQKFVNTLTPAAKDEGLRHLAEGDSPAAVEIAGIYNTIKAPDYGRCAFDSRMIKELGITDYAGLNDLIKSMKGTNLLEYSHTCKEYLTVKNGDYKGAAEFFEKLKKHHKNGIDAYYLLGASVRNENFSYKTAIEVLDYVEKNNISLSKHNATVLLRDKNGIEHLKMLEYFDSKGFKIESSLTNYIADSSVTKFDEFKAKLDLLCENAESKEAYSHLKAASNPLTIEEFKAVLKKHPLSDSPAATVQALGSCTQENKHIALKLLLDPEIKDSPSKIWPVINCCSKENSAFAEKLLFGSEYDVPKAYVVDILSTTTKDNTKFAEKLCGDKDYPKDKIAAALRNVNNDSMPLCETVLETNGLNKGCLPDILSSLVLKEGINSGKIDTNKVKRYTNLLQSPKTSPFVVKLLNEGVDIDTAAFLSKTRQKLENEKNTTQNSPAKKSASANMSFEQQDAFKTLESNGFNEKEAASVIKAASSDGVVDLALQSKAIELAKSGIAKNKIGDIINSAKITGDYNPKIVDDFVNLQNIGLNPLLEKNLAILNNISGADVAVKFNPKLKKQLKGMIQGLSPEMQSTLGEKGFDLDAVNSKLDSKIVKETGNVPQKAKVTSGLRSKQNIKGFERIIIDKYNPDEKIWRNEAATKQWAQEKYDSIKNGDYQSRTYAQANEHRDKMLKEWFDFMDNEPELKDNTCAKIVVADFITKDLLPENADIPPQLDKGLVKEILASAADNSRNVSFSSLYSQRIREKAMSGSNVEEVEVDGIKGKWFTVPQTDSSSPSYKANVDKVKAFSDGTNWCIRTFNAGPYVTQGAMHFFVDENGLTQVCVRENAPGSVYEIQKRQQNATVPIPYINVISDYMSRNGLTAQSGCQKGIDNALSAKPEYDRLRTEYRNAEAQKDYKSILESMGITVKPLEDGTMSISHYNPNVDRFTLSELGVKENELLSNVSKIEGDADFKNSNATSLPNLKEVGGKFIFDESNLSDVRSLRAINGYKIDWGVEDFQQKMQNLDILNDEAGLDYVLAQWKADLDSIDKIKTLEEYNTLMPTVREKYNAIQEKIFDLQFNGAPENRAKAAKIFEEKFMPVIEYSTEVFARVDNRKDIKGSYNL